MSGMVWLSLVTAHALAGIGPQGSGALGPFEPTADVVVPLPADGVLEYSTFVVPLGVTVSFAPTVGNPPVTVLVQSDAEIHGVISVDGQAAGDGGVGGSAGPGASAGGSAVLGRGLGGHGPSGADGASVCQAGGGGGARSGGSSGGRCGCGGPGGSAVGGRIPVHGGSGGGATATQGGGGGGGVFTLAAPNVVMTGLISAAGGQGGPGAGAGGGGVIRLVADSVTGDGLLLASGGAVEASCESGGGGGPGLVRVEAETVDTALALGAVPNAEESAQGVARPWGATLPTVRVVSVDGHTAGAEAIGLAAGSAVTVVLEATGVPAGTRATVAVRRAGGARSTALSTPFALQAEALAATATVVLPDGAGPASLEAWIASFPAP